MTTVVLAVSTLKIAVLGWGSLVWDPASLDLDGPWQTGGPILPLEFSRLTGDGRLVLCIDSGTGSPVTTRWAMSRRGTVAEVVVDLATRLRVPGERIGGCVPAAGEVRTFHKSVAPAIIAWAGDRGIDAVLWSDLPSNFKSFSIARGVAYLAKRDPEEAARARQEFVRAAPEEETLLRRALRENGWIDAG